MATLPTSNTSSRKASSTKLRLGELLVEEALISRETLTEATAESQASGKRLGQILVQNGAVEEGQLAQVLAAQMNLPVVNLNQYLFSADLVKLLPETAARRCRALVLEEQPQGMLVGMADPSDLKAQDDLERILKRPLTLAVCVDSQVSSALDRLYRRTEEISDHARALERDLAETGDFGRVLDGESLEDAPVVRLLQSIFEDAVQVRASDIHVEPQERALQIRFRIDGQLMSQAEADSRIAGALTQRLKLMAGLDISERRLPQDGRFSIKVKGRDIDVRISTLPGQHGESVVLRLLDISGTVRGLDTIGMPVEMVAQLRALLASGSGMLLVTGPTGAGKTTTLYAALAEIDIAAQKVITVEDPVEYRLPGIVQVQTNEKIELTFARVLRATLRQDPDIVLVGEMRDLETVEIGLRAALTGHMVLSTLHTRDAPSALFRLLDMGAPSYMVATSLRAVVAQRLLRLNCESCNEPHQMSPQERAWLTQIGGELKAGLDVYQGRGCAHCNHTGYRDRTGIYEMFVMDNELVEATVHSEPALFMATAGERMRGRTISDHALVLVRSGRASVAEAMRVSNTTED